MLCRRPSHYVFRDLNHLPTPLNHAPAHFPAHLIPRAPLSPLCIKTCLIEPFKPCAEGARMGLLHFEVLSELLDSLPCNGWPACNAPDQPPGMLAAPIGMLAPVRSAALAAASSCRYTRVSMEITYMRIYLPFTPHACHCASARALNLGNEQQPTAAAPARDAWS